MSKDRGVRAQHWLARYLQTHGWPHAEVVGSGRKGSDLLGTPGIVWENKTANSFRPVEWVRQAKAHSWSGQVPVVVYWPNGIGENTPDAAMGIVPLPVLAGLLRAAGYGFAAAESSPPKSPRAAGP